MPAHTPEQLHELFVASVNAHDLDGLIELYEPGCVGADLDGGTLQGLNEMRTFLRGFLAVAQGIKAETRKVLVAQDIALLSSSWRAALVLPDGTTSAATGRSAEVARRQPDGSWQFVIDDPTIAAS